MPTLRTYRRRAAEEIGPFHHGTAAATSTTSALIDTTWPVTSAISQDDLYTDHFLFRPDAAASSDKVRVVKTYNPTTGTLTPDTAWTNAPSEGEVYELHGVIEPLALHARINDALKECFLVVEVTGTPIDQSQRHGLTTIASWLTDLQWVRQAGYLTTSEDRNEVDPFRRVVYGSPVKDGNEVYLSHPGRIFSSNQVLHIKLLKPAYFHCKASGGSFGDQSGLSAETDEAEPVEEWVAASTLREAWRKHMRVLAASGHEGLLRDRAEAEAWYRDQTRRHFSPPPMTFRPIVGWGPVRR